MKLLFIVLFLFSFNLFAARKTTPHSFMSDEDVNAEYNKLKKARMAIHVKSYSQGPASCTGSDIPYDCDLVNDSELNVADILAYMLNSLNEEDASNYETVSQMCNELITNTNKDNSNLYIDLTNLSCTMFIKYGLVSSIPRF